MNLKRTRASPAISMITLRLPKGLSWDPVIVTQDNMSFRGDQKVRIDIHHVTNFYDKCGQNSQMKQCTYYQNSSKPTCMDLVLLIHLNNCVLETGLSDSH